MIESGSLTPGVTADQFGLPPHTALRYEQPAAALRQHLPSYAVLDSEAGPGTGGVNYMLPTWAQVWIVLTEAPITVGIGNRRYSPLPRAALWGVTSQAMPATAAGGVTVCIDVSPLGWARLFGPAADSLRDRVTPLDSVLPAAFVTELVTRLDGSDRAGEVKGILDDLFLRHWPKPNPDEAAVATIMALVTDDATADLTAAAAERGIDLRAMRRLSNRYFGFPPKMLTMRKRFIRTLLAMMIAADRPGYAEAAEDYHDPSHFIRDAKRFLGMTPRQFLKLDHGYLRAALRARALVLGTPTPSLDTPPVRVPWYEAARAAAYADRRREHDGVPCGVPS